MMKITSSALQLSELDISRLYDVLRDEEYVNLERFGWKCESSDKEAIKYIK